MTEDREYCEWIVSWESDIELEEILYEYLMELLEG